MPATWQDRLLDTTDAYEVVGLARDFVAQFSPGEIAHLPELCRPGKIVDAEDVNAYAFVLVRHHCDDGQGANHAIHQLAAFFGGAAQRLAELSHGEARGADDARQSA